MPLQVVATGYSKQAHSTRPAEPINQQLTKSSITHNDGVPSSNLGVATNFIACKKSFSQYFCSTYSVVTTLNTAKALASKSARAIYVNCHVRVSPSNMQLAFVINQKHRTTTL
jgi:hypothetical protein